MLSEKNPNRRKPPRQSPKSNVVHLQEFKHHHLQAAPLAVMLGGSTDLYTVNSGRSAFPVSGSDTIVAGSKLRSKGVAPLK